MFLWRDVMSEIIQSFSDRIVSMIEQAKQNVVNKINSELSLDGIYTVSYTPRSVC